MKSATTVGVVLCALLAAACDIRVDDKGGFDLDIGQGRASDTWTRTYTVAPGALFEIVNARGRIDAEPATGRQVEVVAEREVRAASDEAAQVGLQTATMDETVAPDGVRLEAKLVRAEEQARGGLVVRYRVKVPHGVRVAFRNDLGEMMVTGLVSGVTMSATNGPIRGRDLAGPVDAVTVNGPVELSFVTVNADVKAQTVNGGVEVRLPSDADAIVEARAVNGGVRVADDLTLQTAERERTSLRGTLNAGGPTVSAQVTNGGVFIGTRDSQRGGRPDTGEVVVERKGS